MPEIRGLEMRNTEEGDGYTYLFVKMLLGIITNKTESKCIFPSTISETLLCILGNRGLERRKSRRLENSFLFLWKLLDILGEVKLRQGKMDMRVKCCRLLDT